MTRIIAVANHKGGVGKTTSVAAIGAALAARGQRTLIVDLDAQANLTATFLTAEPTGTIYNALRGETFLPVIPIRENLSIVPSSLDMAGIELDLAAKLSREYVLRRLLQPIQGGYDYVLMDCPPSLGLVTINALVAASELFIPLTAEALPSRGLTKLTNIVQIIRESLNPSLTLTGIMITRWEATNLCKMVEDHLRKAFGVVFLTKIRKNVAIAEAPLYNTDIITYAPDSNGAKDYQALTEEIVTQVIK